MDMVLCIASRFVDVGRERHGSQYVLPVVIDRHLRLQRWRPG